MRTRSALLVAGIAVMAVGLMGCPSDSCGPQTPQVDNPNPSGSRCTVAQGQTVTIPVHLCPTCNETGGSCTPDMSQVASGYIYLDISTQACSGGESCPAPSSCNVNATTCTFAAPTPAATPYNVVVPNGQGTPYTISLEVVPSGAPTSCALASGPSTTF